MERHLRDKVDLPNKQLIQKEEERGKKHNDVY